MTRHLTTPGTSSRDAATQREGGKHTGRQEVLVSVPGMEDITVKVPSGQGGRWTKGMGVRGKQGLEQRERKQQESEK
jgi:hypothetical protein